MKQSYVTSTGDNQIRSCDGGQVILGQNSYKWLILCMEQVTLYKDSDWMHEEWVGC
jgi:hypothetical protein